MLGSSFGSIPLWMAVWTFIYFQHAKGEDHDDMGLMSKADFADLHLCEEPPPPMNGEMMCSKHKKKADVYVCRVNCDSGFQFPNGRKKARHLCDIKTGKWTPEFSFPDCFPVCEPHCLNNGECSEDNHCICPPDFRGDRCQYSLSLCDPVKGLHVTADWMCNHTRSDSVCILNCPQGTKYESQPAELYKCSLDGKWEPSFAPKCVPINIIEPPALLTAYAVSDGGSGPSSGVCATWSSSHFRTFDGGVFSFRGGCSYLLAKDCQQDTFAIHVQNGEPCPSVTDCRTVIKIYVGDEEFLLTNGEDGPIVQNEGKVFNVPTSVNGLLFQMLSDYVTVSSSLGFKLKWNRKNTILVRATDQIKNKTCGLCGKFDGSTLNDFETSDGSLTDSVEVFANSWAMDHLGERCESSAIIEDSCAKNTEKSLHADRLCKAIYNDKFQNCHQILHPKSYYDACRMDQCSCGSEGSPCFCNSLAEYFRECNRLGGKIEGGWRSEELCPLSCQNGMVYKDCGTSCPQTCKGTVYDCEDDHCVDGCHCPDGSLLHNGECVAGRDCPCLHNEKEYENGARVLQDCNACECTAGKWECTKEKCEARCSSTGDPHYTTFDGLSYEFLGSCPYFLVFNENFTIVQETGPCPETSGLEDSAYCTTSIKIEFGADTLVLEQNAKVTLNGKPIEVPFSENSFTADMATSIFLKVSLKNGVSVLWDGLNRIYIDIPPTLFDRTMGLCGTYNHNQNDDFLTPERDIEADVAAFAARWQASDTCHKRSRRSGGRSACMNQPQKLAGAEMLCSLLKSELFSACHGELEPYSYFKACVHDLCSCGTELERCICPVLADYSMSCSRRNVVVNWIDEVPNCKPDCPGGQTYMECGNPCTCSCSAIASETECRPQCVQGCTCPDGMTMGENDFCIPIDQCPCFFENREYSSGDIMVRGQDICKCSNAKWECRQGNEEELNTLKPEPQMEKIFDANCDAENNEEFTECLDECPITCQNARLPPKCKTEQCKPGCRCKDGFILDANLKKCVKLKDCGCIHATHRYSEGDTIKQACNLCTCREGEWSCTEKVCPGICTAWGESHFKSFDGKIFDFQGNCEYILSRGKTKTGSFSLNVQNEPCGTSGITCSKAFTLDLGPVHADRGDVSVVEEQEKITLSRDEPLPKTSSSSRFVVLESGLFVLVFTDIGVTLRWDRGTRIYLSLDPKWRNRVTGLCGNFNDDQSDDFLTPFGGIPEARPSIFANSWKVQEFCPQPQEPEDTCALHPHRRSWAQQTCGILQSDLFKACRSAVNVDPFYERCVFDSCACDMGGDCDCLCTAIAAYAQECNMHGVPVRWRSQELCPIQCEECAHYDSCISSCPKKTCENEDKYSKILASCTDDICVEGCDPKPCPEGQIYNNGKEYKCIPKEDCVVPCLEINGVVYNEGDRVTDPEVANSCQSCHCQRGAVVCTGSPCINIEPTKPCLQGGWTPWMNTAPSVGGDSENLSNPLLKATYENFCGISNMSHIECRAAETKVPVRENGQNVVCELPTGLECLDNQQNNRVCDDYEIRVLCDCGKPPIETTTLPPTTTPPPKLPPVCEETGWTPWMSAHLPDEEGEAELLEALRVNHYFCDSHQIENIECRSVMGWHYVVTRSGEDSSKMCNQKLGYVCSGKDCEDHEVRVFCKCGPEVTPPPPPACVTGWTEYFNTDHPDRSDMGDDESLDRIRENHLFCAGGTLEDVECKALIGDDLVDFTSLDPFGLKCSKNVGFVCVNDVRPERCPDFMVRFYCACEPETTTVLITTPPPVVIEPVPVECGWTPWLNLDAPDSDGVDVGDIEDLAKIQYLYKTCGGKDLIDIECRMSRTHHSFKDSPQKNLQCDTEVGFRCNNDDQIGNCFDYEIRLLCMYDWCYPPTTPIPTTQPPTTTQNPCPDGEVYDECAYHCEHMCSSFVYEMSSKCGAALDGCIAGCRPAVDCKPPMVWRDYYSCVPKEECTCIAFNETGFSIVAPNDVFITECEKCQCVYDDLKCYDIPNCGITVRPRPRIITFNITQEDCWTSWINIDKPTSDGGDLEVMGKIRKLYDFCYDPIKIECRTAESFQNPQEVGQIVACDLETGLACWNTDNKPEECYDYEIRFFCPCPTTLAPTTPSTTPIPTLPPGPCVHGWTEWFNSHQPGPRGEYESVQNARTQHVFCDNNMISAMQCNRADAHMNKGTLQRGVLCDLRTGLVCNDTYQEDDEKCWDYEVRFFCDCPTEPPPTTTTPAPTLPPSPCIHGWTSWFNNHVPSPRGEYENVHSARVHHPFCAREMISDIQCNRANSFMNKGALQRGVVCDLQSGLVCNDTYLEDAEPCWDYEIRFFCNCPTEPPQKYLEEVTTPIPAKVPCAYWSDWFNEHHPTVGGKGSGVKGGVKGGSKAIKGDTEKVMPLKLRRENHFCLEGEITEIECREAETDIDYTNSEANKLVCNLVGGFRCRGKDQPNGVCKDYKIRYFCGCEEAVTEPVLITTTMPPVYVEPCTVYYNVIDGPEPLADSSLRASSSKTSDSGPQSARLSSVDSYKSAGAWVSGDLDEAQFIEVDLGRLQPIYGIVTKGRNGREEWVKTYKVLYSMNGRTWAYVTEGDNIDKVFSGNFDSDTPVEHIFRRPFEARYVRVHPVSFHREIALRFDVLGCAEGMTTLPIITTTGPPCMDDMGLTNGILKDYQISTSSDRNPESDGRYVRLYTAQTEHNAGGWVAELLDHNQFVQIDFVEPRVLTGVKIQGRDMVPQWVTAFQVSYSSTGVTWSNVTDQEGEVKIFPGNHNSHSVSTVFFPSPIRTQLIRIHPVAWENWIAMRLEILGCYEELKEEVKDKIMTTPKTLMLEVCHEPMGFENHQLPTSLISVSSSLGPGSDVSRIRLHTPSEDQGTGGWIAAPYDYKPIITIDFTGKRNITGVLTQGLEDFEKWIMSYYVQYSLDNVTWHTLYDKETGDKAFPGNFDSRTTNLRLFNTMIETRFLRLILIDYHVGPALRMEVLGCFLPYEIATSPPPLITTTEFCAEYGPWISLSDPLLSPYGDIEPIDQIISASGICHNPYEIQCRAMVTGKDYAQTGQSLVCNLEKGLQCLNHEQSSFTCYNYEVRIKCWTCGVETTTTPQPVTLCPDVPEFKRDGCPTYCPPDHSCDGQTCVPDVDCPCYKDGKRFQPPNMFVTKECHKCECILGGYSTCKPIECDPCLPGQQSEMDEHCACHCVGCPEGTLLCPTSGDCIREDQWCDGVKDCVDDETGCPTTPPPTTIAPTTTEVPIICSTDYLQDTDTCEMTANMFDTFDGLTYQYDICDHVLMKERNSNLFSVTVHKSCSPNNKNSCQRYIIIEVDDITLKLGPKVTDITVQDNRVSHENFWFVSQRFKDFELKKKGSMLIFRSSKYHFDVTWDAVQDAKIYVSKCLSDQIVGLCGFYNQRLSDDRTTPEGLLANSNQDFGDSWSIGSLERCAPSTCPEYIMKTALSLCSKLQEEPFNSSCANYLKMESRIESCIVFMCECMQRTDSSSAAVKTSGTADVFYDIFGAEKCKCQALESFVEACEAVTQTLVVDWRIPNDCTPDCPEGTEWMDCGPGCELTCDNYHERDTICTGSCTPGCYCPSGLIRHNNRCVKPKMCQDCVCRGHGDPNYITFDGKYYAFQGNCTYVLAQYILSDDPTQNFRVLGTNVECPEEPHTSCNAGIQVIWNGHVIEKFKNKPVYLDEMQLNKDDSPYSKDGISITFVPKKSTIIHIKSINLAVRYFDQMYGFNIELPAFFYFNKTEGLCGVCNFIQSDDLYHKEGYVTEDIDDFAYSWLEKPYRREECHIPRVPVPEPPPGICNFTISPCEVFLDPTLYSKSCQNDVTYSQKPNASMCRSKFQYAQQCCERGIALVEWLKLSGCETSCPEGMSYDCTSACPRTCDNYRTYRADDCDLQPLYTCRCGDGRVLRNGSCVDEAVCETCDAAGHVVGERWSVGPCEYCECLPDLTTRCTVTSCPDPPVCREKETLEKVEARGEGACCDVFLCKMNQIQCPDPILKNCSEGEANVVIDVNECPEYKCECMPELCPPLIEPYLDEGESISVEKEGCCPHYRTDCLQETCSQPPLCGLGFKLSTYEGKCCLKYSCVPKNNVCVYQYQHAVVNGSQVQLSPEDTYEEEQSIGSTWQDGLCRKCKCVEIEGTITTSCMEEICQAADFPDADKYIYEAFHIPGSCCPKYRRVSCQVNGVPYPIESEWVSPEGDPCKSYRCVMRKGEANVLEKSTICDTTCPNYAVYTAPTLESKKCCGECKPVACEENGVLYQDGDSWISTAKPCYTAECSVMANGTRITYRGESCPSMPENCPMENVRTDPKGCCTYCKRITETCATVQIPLYETRGYFNFFDRQKGMCENGNTIEGLAKCAGQCAAESHYSNVFGDFQSICNCCLPLHTTDRVVVLDCEDGSKVQKVYKQPSSCVCNSCSGKDAALESLNNVEPY